MDKKLMLIGSSCYDGVHGLQRVLAHSMVKRECRRCPIARFRLYDLRHTFLTRLGEAGADPLTIQKIAGHASILISQRYVHPTPERLEDAFAKLETYNGAKVEELRAKEKTQVSASVQ